MERVLKYAESFCPPGKAAHAVGLIKLAAQSGADMSLERALAIERELQQQLFLSDDAREGLSAFLARRKATFTGR